jgi:PAS domain S-box-containing protein
METLQHIFNKSTSVVAIINHRGVLEFVNPTIQHILGFEVDSLIGRTITDTPLLKDNCDFRLIREIIQSRNGTSYSPIEKIVYDVKDRKRFLLLTISEIEQNKYLIIGHDITATKELELETQRINRSLKIQQKEFSDSLAYAQRIQEAILQNPDRLAKSVGNSFILYKPKDTVSGDFYWFTETDSHVYIVVGDCTGHGIPGAMLTVLAINLLREIIQKHNISDPGEILTALDKEVIITLSDENGHNKSKDGLDLSLLKLTKESGVLEYAAAFRPVALVRNGIYEELKGERYPIGFFEIEKSFKTYTVQLIANDCIYLFSDGYIDQFGGERDKKFSKAKFRQLIESIQDLEIEDQGGFLEYAFRNWKQETPQTDDVVVLGFKYDASFFKNSRTR